MKLLDQELQEVSDWFGLGLHLDISAEELHSIKYEPTLRRIQDFRTEMFAVWMKKLPEPSWPRVVKALVEIGREKLARKIALKYGKNSLLKVLYTSICGPCHNNAHSTVYKHNSPLCPETLYRSSSPILGREDTTTTGHPKSGTKLLPIELS